MGGICCLEAGEDVNLGECELDRCGVVSWSELKISGDAQRDMNKE
jgi:hypothetical protein